MSAICSLTGAVAGAAAPMTTPGTNCGPTAGVLSADNSGLLPPLRAESAAKGETWPERVAGSAALRRLWVIGRAADGVPELLGAVAGCTTSSLEPRETACMTSSSTPEGAAPTNCRIEAAVTRPSQEAIA